jgi:CP family cyanate transporter-like MFS transporter
LPETAHRRRHLLVLAEIVLVAASLRGTITAVSPLVDEIKQGLHLSSAGVGLLTTMPLLAFGALSAWSAPVARRFGLDRVLVVAMALVTIGTLLRSGGTVATAFGGTALLGAGIATGNTLLPSVVRRAFPDRAGQLTSLYLSVMVLFAGLAAAVSVPLSEDAGLGWQGALACWAAPSALAFALWLPRWSAGAPAEQAAGVAPRPVARLPWRSPLAWQVTIYMGMQSTVFYAMVAWLPEILRADGLSAHSAGLMFALSQLASLCATIGTPLLAARMRSQSVLVLVSSLIAVVALVGLLVDAGGLAALWSSLLGFATGAWFALTLMFLILRARDPGQTAALSGMAQSVGYGIAALGPPVLGALHDATGGWRWPLVVLLAFSVAACVVGMLAGRDRVVGA